MYRWDFAGPHPLGVVLSSSAADCPGVARLDLAFREAVNQAAFLPS